MKNFMEHFGRTILVIFMAMFGLAWFFYYALGSGSPISKVIDTRFYSVPNESNISNLQSLAQPEIILKNVNIDDTIVTYYPGGGTPRKNIHVFREDVNHNFKYDVWVKVNGVWTNGASLSALNYKLLSTNSSKTAVHSNAEQYYLIRYYYRGPNDMITIFTTTVVVHN